jgi:large subunit ribosomal protein L2
MPIKKVKPTSPGRRHVIQVKELGLHKGGPMKSLVEKKKKTGGRNNLGRVTAWQRGGGSRQHYRLVDFKRAKHNIEASVVRFEYDPNRSANIALILYVDGAYSYIISPKGLKVGDKIFNGPQSPIKTGNSLALRDIPVGTNIHCVELNPGKGAQFCRAAGSYCNLAAKDTTHATLKLRSGEMRKVLVDGQATIGEVGNGEHSLASLGKAGANRWRGKRPHVRGVAMNPIDHPHGGGEGRTSGGRNPVTPWGKPTKGYVTRKNKRTSKLIIKSRRLNK